MNSIYKFDFELNEDILLLEYDRVKHLAERLYRPERSS